MQSILSTPSPIGPSGLDLRRYISPSPEKALVVDCRNFIIHSPSKKQIVSASCTGSPTSKKRRESHSLLKDTSVRHIVFDFTLVDGRRPRFPSDEELETLSSLYPTQFGVGVQGVFLILYVTELPPLPWPLTVAGLPLYIATNEFDIPWPFGTPKNHSRSHVLEDIDAQEYVSDEIFMTVIKWFDECSNVTISSILWSAGTWHVTIPDDCNTSDLPSRVCRASCSYLYQSEVPEQPEAAFRQQHPATIRDESAYDILRPGVMVSSDKFLGDGPVPPRSELFTTAGVLVKDKHGDEFVTVANHGFPLGEETVFHPSPRGTVIGTVERRLGETDLALVRLRDGVIFENKCFQSTSHPTVIEFTQVVESVNELKLGDVLHMDNPFTGHIESVYYGTARRRIPRYENSPEFLWVTQDWGYFGQHADSIPAEGSCGSAVWDNNGKLVCFFRYLTKSGPRANFGFGISAMELKNFGLELSGGH